MNSFINSLQLNFQFLIDKSIIIWYNIYTVKGTPKTETKIIYNYKGVNIMAKVTKKTVSQIQAYNRIRNRVKMKNLAIAGSIGIEIMKPNKVTTAKSAHEQLSGVSKAQLAWALKKGEEEGFFNRIYNKKGRRFEYVLNNEQF